ncbi:MAG: glycosyltransferase family 4 protein [Mycobacteriales bacterium]
MREYALVLLVSAAVTFLLVPLVRRLAMSWGAVKAPRDRDVHKIPTPQLGGVAMVVGVVAGLFVASQMPTLHRTFAGSNIVVGVGAGALLICAINVLDDRYDLDPWTKLTGDVLASGVMVLAGVQIYGLYLPFHGIGTLLLDRTTAVPITILFCALLINAVNFIDGLDGLAAGVSAIAALAFFAYTYHLGRLQYDVAFAPTLICAVTAGCCIGFLPHNFNPARIFMGDSGARMLGLLLAAASVSASSADSQSFDRTTLGSLPVLVPSVIVLTVLAVPLADLVLAVVRRVSRGRSPFSADAKHLHHRILMLGHSQRRAVLIIYFWTALVASGGVAIAFVDSVATVLAMVGALAVVGLILSMLPRLIALRRGISHGHR